MIQRYHEHHQKIRSRLMILCTYLRLNNDKHKIQNIMMKIDVNVHENDYHHTF